MKNETAFKFGVAFGQFSARPNQDTYSAVLNILPAGIRGRFPAIDGVRKKLWWDLDPVSAFGDEWTADGYYQIGLLAYLRFILSLPGHPDTEKQAQDIQATEHRLRVEFAAQGLPDEVRQAFVERLSRANHDPNEALSDFVDKCELMAALRSIGLDGESLKMLGQAIDKDGKPQEGKVGAHVRKWRDSVVQKATDGSWKVGINTASRLITEAILRSHGWE